MNMDISNVEQTTINIPPVQFHKTNLYTTYNDTPRSSDGSSSSSTDMKNTEQPIMIKVNSDVPLQPNNIQDEGSINTYTDNHFVTLSNRDLDNLHDSDSFFTPHFSNSGSNSPIMSDSNPNSNTNSDDETNSHTDTNLAYKLKKYSIKGKYAKLNTTDIEKYIKK